jgi:flagellar biosynthesis/type III secretory pathway ATPase
LPRVSFLFILRWQAIEVIAALSRNMSHICDKHNFHLYVQFETGSAGYEWLNRAIGIGAGMRMRNAVIYDAYLVK